MSACRYTYVVNTTVVTLLTYFSATAFLFRTAFCSCLKRGAEAMSACVCGEEENDTDANRENTVEWSFSGERATDSAVVRGGGREVLFSPTYSTGNAVCLGGEALNADLQHFWEIKMNHMVYGSSLMVGIATDRFDVDAVQNDFEVPLGRDDSSWGYNYNGDLHHGGVKTKKGERWMQGAILGVHLDRFRGTLEYYLNREPLGIAYTGTYADSTVNAQVWTLYCSSLIRHSQRSRHLPCRQLVGGQVRPKADLRQVLLDEPLIRVHPTNQPIGAAEHQAKLPTRALQLPRPEGLRGEQLLVPGRPQKGSGGRGR